MNKHDKMDVQDLKKALKFPLSDYKLMFLLGFVLLLADLVNEVHVTDDFSLVIKLILTLVALVMSVLEAGYLFKVIEETTVGSNSLPKFNNFKSIFIHGIKELIVSTTYIMLPIFLVILSTYFLISSSLTHNVRDLYLGYAFLIVGVVSILVVGFILQGVFLNMAHNHGTLRSGFDWRKIKEKIRKVGYKNLILTYLIAFATFGSLVILFSDTIKSIHIIGFLILMVFIEPYLIIFNIRLLGLIDID